MKDKIAIYLAGSIQKGHEKSEGFFWGEGEISALSDCLHDFEISFLNPALRSDDLSDQFSVFGRDMLQVLCSDAVFVDARDRRGLGVGAEMMWAKFNRIPVVTLAPKNSHYHKNATSILGVPVFNFIHPFVDSLSDQVVESLEEGGEWIRILNSPDSQIKIKGIEHIEDAMQHYKAAHLSKDDPMLELIRGHEVLKSRIEQLHLAV